MDNTVSLTKPVIAKLYNYEKLLISRADSEEQVAAINNAFRAPFLPETRASQLIEFIDRVNTLTNTIDCGDYVDSGDQQEGSNKLKGDYFELFSYIFLSVFAGGVDGLVDVDFAPYDQTGYDFIAINHKGTPCVIQSKFVSNPRAVFGADENGDRVGSLETFFGTLPEGLVVDPKALSRVLFTTARKVHPYYTNLARTDKSFKIYNYNRIRRYVKNTGFWQKTAKIADALFPVPVDG